MIENRFRELRVENNLTMKDVIEKSNIEISISHLSLIERNEASMSIPVLIKLANFYDVSVDYVLKLSNKRKKRDSI